MKKALTYALALAMLLSLAACSQFQTTQQKADQPDKSQTQAATSTPEQTTDPEQAPATNPTQLSSTAPLAGEDLIYYFQRAYDICGQSTDTSDEQIEMELFTIKTYAKGDGKKLPDDYSEQYRAWRPVDETQAPVVEEQATAVQQVTQQTQPPQQSQQPQQPAGSSTGSSGSTVVDDGWMPTSQQPVLGDNTGPMQYTQEELDQMQADREQLEYQTPIGTMH